MAEIIPQVVESLTNMPQIERPIAAIAVLGATAVVAYVETKIFSHQEEKFAVDNYANNSLLETTLVPDTKQNRRKRMSSPMLVAAGLGLSTAALLANPTYETSHLKNDANVVVVEDLSTSMLLTHDLENSNASRSQAVQKGIFAAEFGGNLGVVQAAATNKLVLPPTNAWETKQKVVVTPVVDPNGGQLKAAIETAASVLPLAKDGIKHEGSIVILSDGTIEDTASDMADEAKKLQAQGISVKVVVPGSSTGTYTTTSGTKPTPAGANPSVFSAFGEANVAASQSATSVENDVKAAVESAGTTSEQHPWYPPLGLGLALFGAGVILGNVNSVRRVV